MSRVLLYVVTNPKKKEYKDRVSYQCHGYLEGMKHVIVSSRKQQQDIQKDSFLYMKGYNMTASSEGQTYLNLNDNSMIFKTGQTFPINDATIKNLIEAPEVSLSEAKCSPKKRKIAVVGTLSKVEEVYHGTSRDGHSYKKRMLVLKDEDETIDIKLWGEDATSFTFTEGQRVKMTNVKVDQYNRGGDTLTTLESTDLLTVSAVHSIKQEKKTINIWGVMKTQNIVKVNLDDDSELIMDADLLETYLQACSMTFQAFRSETPLELTVDLDGQRIQQIHV